MVTNDNKEIEKIEELLRGQLEATEEQRFLEKFKEDIQVLDNNIKQFANKDLEEFAEACLQEDDISKEAKQAALRIEPPIFTKLGLVETSELLQGSSPFKLFCKIYKHGVELIEKGKKIYEQGVELIEKGEKIVRLFCNLLELYPVRGSEKETTIRTKEYALPNNIGSLIIEKTEQGNEVIFTFQNISYTDYRLILEGEEDIFEAPIRHRGKHAKFSNIPDGYYNVYSKRGLQNKKYFFQFCISNNERDEL